jgi:TRAP-type mannitol/chloroaromatic compound transport system substrate-binding protein
MQGGMQVFVLDTATMQRISEITDNLADAKAAQNAFYARVLKSQRDFKARYRTREKWSDPEVYSGH